MITLVRHFIIFIAVALLAFWLPRLFDTLLYQRMANASLSYSVVDNDFYLTKKQNKTLYYQSVTTAEMSVWKDMQAKFPLRAYRQLQLEKRLPKQLNGVAISVAEIEAWRKRFRYDPRWQDAPDYSIFQLFEANGKHAALQANDELLRVADSITVYRTETNEVLTELTEKIQHAFDKAGFDFPAKLATHNSKQSKPYEEGLYAIDQQGDLFHGRIFNGEFTLKNISKLADGFAIDQQLSDLKLAFLQVDEAQRGNIRALLIDTSNQVYLLKTPGYQLMKLPINDFDYKQDRLNLNFNPVYMDLVVSRAGQRDKYIIDHQGKLLNHYSQVLIDKNTHWSRQVKAWLLPFKLSMSDNKHVLANPQLIDFSFKVITLQVVLLSVFIIWRIKTRRSILVADLLWLALTGVFGAIALLLLPKKSE